MNSDDDTRLGATNEQDEDIEAMRDDTMGLTSDDQETGDIM
jgi:hypothetical protein